jgi:hypothetical protein
MAGRTKFLAAGLTAGAVIATSGVSMAGGDAAVRGSVKAPRDVATGQATGVFSRGPVQGIVIVEALPNKRRARLGISLHGLPVRDGTSNTYLVADTKPCSKVIDDTDIVISSIIVANTEGDIHFKGGTTRLRKKLGATRTLRVYEREQDADVSQLACVSARRWVDKSSPKI